jgi:hypothetical protein
MPIISRGSKREAHSSPIIDETQSFLCPTDKNQYFRLPINECAANKNRMTNKQINYYFFFMCIASFYLLSCREEEEVLSKGNLTGSVLYVNSNVSIAGGLLDDSVRSNHRERRSYRFKISERPIDFSIRDTFLIYVSSLEKINIDFILTSMGTEFQNGTYNFQNISLQDPFLPRALLLHNGLISTAIQNGSTSSLRNALINGGSVTISGTFPAYTLDLNLVTNEGTLTGTVSGTFLTRADWLPQAD